jgi:hypothetical protein
MNTNLVIIPSRSRPDSIDRAVKALKENSILSDICVAIDDDQADLYPRIDGVIYEVNPRLKMNGTLNLVANKYADKYETIFFMGDDHLPSTQQWDHFLSEAIKSKGYGLAYGNDLFQGKNLATAVMMSTNIIKSFGFMAPPKLVHLFMDNFWMLLGMDLNAIWYFDDVIIEHLHFLNGKSTADAGYLEVNAPELSNADRIELQRYINEEYPADLAKFKESIGIK